MKRKIKFNSGTPFQQMVWRAIARIPRGKTVTYKELAKQIGCPTVIRAVANAVGANPHPGSIPCHRIVRSDGTLGGYSAPGGIKRKRELLKKEGAITGVTGSRMI